MLLSRTLRRAIGSGDGTVFLFSRADRPI